MLTRIGVAARAALFVVFGVIALSMSAPQSASALFDTCDWASQSINQMADPPGVNGESIFPSVAQWDNKRELLSGAARMPGDPQDYTLYELDAMRGLNWASTQRSQGESKSDDPAEDDECSLSDEVKNTVAQMVFDTTKVISRAAISIKELSSNPSPLAALYEHTVEGDDSVVDKLNNGVFKLAVPTMILLTGLWVFGKWRKGDMREVWAGVGWAAFVVIAVSAFLVNGNYVAVVRTADSGIAQANAALSETVLSSAIDEVAVPCDLPAGAPQRGLRVSSCAMYDTLVFRPWAIGQFGDEGKQRIAFDNYEDCDYGKGPRCSDLRVKQVIVQSITNFDQYKEPPKDKTKIKAKEDQYGALRAYIADNKDSAFYEQWSGRKPGTRISMAVYSLVAALIVGIMVIVLSALTLLWHAVTLIMVILLPLVAIISIHPTQQKLLRGWWQTFVHSFVLRAGFGVILTILLLFYQLILPLPVPLGMQLLMLLLVTIAVIMLLKNLLSGKFSPQVAGAEDALGVGEAFNKAAALAPGAAAGAARVSGRVAGGGIRRVAWTADRVLAKGKGRERLQQWGVLGQSKREQRQTAHRQAESVRMDYEQKKAQVQAQSQAEKQVAKDDAPAPRRRGRRVSDTGPAPSPQKGPAPEQHQPAPAPQPVPRPRPAPAEPAAPRRPQVPVAPAPAPRPAPTPPTPPTPAPAPRDPRRPDGRAH